MLRKVLWIAIASMTVTAPAMAQMVFDRNDLPNEQYEQRFQMDNGMCIGQAHMSVPNAPVYIPPLENGLASAYSNGMMAGQAQAAQANVEAARTSVYVGCMAANGWTRVQ